MRNSTISSIWRGAALLLTAGLFVAAPYYDVTVNFTLNWHFSQPSAVQGALELLAMLGIMVAAMWTLPRRTSWIVTALLSIIYLRRHHVDVPLLICWAYVEFIVALGAVVLKGAKGKSTESGGEDLAKDLLVGVSVWTILVAAASLLQMGTPRLLGGLALVIAVPLLYIHRRSLMTVQLAGRAKELSRPQMSFALAAWVWLLAQVARTNSVYEFDSLWYGLRPQHVLTGDSGIFAQLSMGFPVFYFPKLFEILTLPLGATGEASFLMIPSLLAVLGLVWVASRLFSTVSTTWPARYIAYGALMTIPAIAALGLSAKPDVFACVLAAIAVYYAVEAFGSRRFEPWLWSLLAAILASSAKLTFIPFAGIAVMLALIRLLVNIGPPLRPSVSRPSLVALALGFTAATIVVARTYHLTGLPTIGPDQLLRVWEAMGFTLREPAGIYLWKREHSWADVPMLLVDWPFRPSTMEKGIDKWVGNLWLWLAVAAMLVHGGRASKRLPMAWWGVVVPVITLTVWVAISIGFQNRGGDGNYFMLGIMLGVVVAATGLSQALSIRPNLVAAATAGGMLLVLFTAWLGFCTAGWSQPGTRTWDLDFNLSVFDSHKVAFPRVMTANALYPVLDVVKSKGANPRVVGSGPSPEMYWLPARFEYTSNLALIHPDILLDVESLTARLKTLQVELVVVDRHPEEWNWPDLRLRELIEESQADGVLGNITLETDQYWVVDLTSVRD